ncbi:hypothetical protein FAM09_11945 [Niastella caeni]|uniref:Nuclear transport factor 2 family protein n=1 Tax=Niastella caeni TaxID=2569763 RepID=A0A4S8HUI8_9BACT|nr:hypothetical protein [Niastella caeni]THU39220.1 hypothetical protein FAM09_11945 [Niastella caeni]
MSKRIILLGVLCIIFQLSHTQNSVDQKALAQVLVKNASEMASLLNSGDYKGFLKYIHPIRISAGGGEAKMITLLNNQNAQLKSKGVQIKGTVFDQPSEIVKSKNELQCTISQHTELKPAKGRVVTHTTLIAISNDNGKSWKFVDASNLDMAIIRKMFPNLSSKITIPPKQQPTVYKD